jgi:hypothetical protein
MKYGEPTPLFLGHYPLTTGVQAICFFHFICCVFFVAVSSSVTSEWFGNFEIHPELQIAISSWSLIGVLAITGALVGSSHRQSLPLQVYGLYLLATDGAFAYIAISLLVTGSDCTLVQQNMETQRLGLSLSCGLVTACWFFCFLAVWSVCLFCAYTVWQLQALLKSEEAESLLEHMDPVIKSFREGTHLGFSQTKWEEQHEGHSLQDRFHVPDADPLQWAAPRRGLQPEWGSMQPKSTGAESVWK